MAAGREAWCYASGLVAAQVGRLLDAQATAELLELGDVQDLLSRVRQTALGPDLMDAEDWVEVGRRLDGLFLGQAAALGRACPDGTVADVFGLQEESRLLKRTVKGRWAESGPQAGSREGPEGRREPVDEDLTKVLEPLEEALAQARELGEAPTGREPWPRAWLLDLLFDGALLRAELALAEEIGRRWQSPGVADTLRRWVEVQCLLVLGRARRHPERLATVRQYFGLPVGEGGSLAGLYQAFEPGSAEEQRAWRSALKGLFDGELVAGDQQTEGRSASGEEVQRVARRADELLMEQARRTRFVPFGPEPVFGYLWGLWAETDNLKAVVGGLQAGVPADRVREQLRATYV